jgi:hypothetical protein
MAETVRIDSVAYATLSEIASKKHVSMTEALSRAVEAYRRALFFEAMAAGYASLTEEQRAEETAERDIWDTTSADGLPDE